jgi:hypothetical protein
MPEKKHNTAKQKPVHTIRCREVTADIMLRQSNAGYSYYDFELGRSYQSMGTGREVHGATLFENHEEDAIEVVRQAARWIRAKMRPTPAEEVKQQGVQEPDAHTAPR